MEDNIKYFRVETSAHHCHLTQDTLNKLFGEGFDLNKHIRFDLSQHGQYASTIRVAIVTKGKDGKEHRMDNVSILGPARKYNQVEISLTDARVLHVDVPVRQSGRVEGSTPVSIISYDPVTHKDDKRVDLPFGLVAQKRHIHINPDQAKWLGVTNNEIVKVKVLSPIDRNVIFDDVVVRIDPTFDLSMHLDTDEANACGLKGETKGYLVK